MTQINYPSKWDDIIDVNCFDGDKRDTFSNFNGDFNGADVKPFCESLADTGKYTSIVVTCFHCD